MIYKEFMNSVKKSWTALYDYPGMPGPDTDMETKILQPSEKYTVTMIERLARYGKESTDHSDISVLYSRCGLSLRIRLSMVQSRRTKSFSLDGIISGRMSILMTMIRGKIQTLPKVKAD